MMNRTLIRGLVLLYSLSSMVMTSGANFNLTANDLRPVLQVVSRLATVRLRGQPAFSGSFGICFADSEAFRPLAAAIANYKGTASWLLVSRPPEVCLIAVPQEAEVRTRQIASKSQLKKLILQDVLPLSVFLEEKLRIVGAPSKGIRLEPEIPTRAVSGDGPGGPTLLVSDPERYISNGFRSTSGRDRIIDFWMSEHELDALYSVLHPARNVGSDVGESPILRRASESTHENFIVLSKDVASLRYECEIIAAASFDLKAAMQRVIRICSLAETDDLGILVIGG